MSGLLTLGIVLSAVDSLSPVLGTATGNLGKLETKISSVSANITKLGTTSLALGTAITAPLKGALDDYQNVAAAQGEIASLGIDDSGIKSITKSAREFSNEFAGTTAPEFIKASYDIKSGISSLSDTAVGEFTKTAAMTAAATKSSTGEMTSLFATGYGIYRKQFEDFGASTVDGWKDLSAEEKDIKFGEYFSAGIAGSVQAFKTDGANMSGALGALGASATSAGVSFAEQLSVLGQLQATMSGSEAATKYKAFLGSVSGAGDKLDLQFTDANDQLMSMPEIIGTIKDKYGDTIDALESAELKKAFGTEEAVALVKLMYNETDTLTQNINTMGTSLENGTEKTRAMAKAMNKGKELDLLGQQMNNVSTLIGGAFAPLALSLSETIGGVVKSVSSWMEENEELSSTIFTGIAIIGGLLMVLGSVGVAVGAVGMVMPFLSGGIGLLTGSFGILGTVMSTVGRIFLMNPIGLAVTAIAGAAYLIYSNWEPIGAFFSNLWAGIKETAAPVLDWIDEKIGSVTGAMDAVGGFFGFGDDSDSTNTSNAISTKGSKQSIEKTQRDVLSSSVSSTNQYMHKNNQANSAQSKVIYNEPTYHIAVSNPSSDVDVIRAVKEHEKKQRNKSYEDD
ncbi:phage tail tape measure protein [Sulfurimonas sp.]|uniref:phage tail tape measure protein n=1 Tax=Sulfurimonas sp. TaxID=2022749 RepID=UPI0025CF1126|nr:phage tail tape measure protein [Sulfurimonas sp.]